MVKLFGILFAFAGCSALGFLKSAQFKTRRRLLLDFENLLLHLSTEISYFKEPLPQIFERLSADSNRLENGQADTEITLLLRNWLTVYHTEPAPFPQLWQQAVEFVYGELPLTEEDLQLMKKCGAFLGQSDFRRQQEHFALLNRQICGQIAESEEMIRTRGRLYGRLGISTGMMVAVVLL